MEPHPFTTNPFRTRNDLLQACISLLDPLEQVTSNSGALVRCGSTATHYDERAAQLEGFARPLWGLASLIAGGDQDAGTERWVRGLVAGTDEESDEFWGKMRDRDQRMVEACPIGYTLLVAGNAFWDPLSEEQRENVQRWLYEMNAKEMPQTNWLWFRIFANLGLQRCGAHFSQSRISADLKVLDTFYRGDGWSNDGPEGFTQMDYYSGSFAIQVLQLLWVKYAGHQDPERAELYANQAKDFALDFVHYFDETGRAVPFGRSLTYRFAMAAFWGALAAAEIELPRPLTWGVVKGLLLRNMRWWSKQEDIFQPNGILNIGYTYPNMYMSENYNSPGSPYWCMLAFLPLSLGENHPFWRAKEEEYPSGDEHMSPPIRGLKHPLHITVRRGGHTFLLSSGQECHYPMRAGAAKYGKFAYSSAFGYSVPTGDYNLEAYAPDNMLAVSEDGGETWKVRRKVEDAFIRLYEGGIQLPVLISLWKPWRDVEIKTYLIPPAPNSSCWHVRIHRIRTDRALETAEGAFAICGHSAEDGRPLSEYPDVNLEGILADESQAYVVSKRAGVAGISDLSPQFLRKAEVLKADANSNIMEPRTVIPMLKANIGPGEYIFVTAVFAKPVEEKKDWRKWRDTWVQNWDKEFDYPEELTDEVEGWIKGPLTQRERLLKLQEKLKS
ncbi:hypothetical protein H2201_006508 [Coniosporium apollinis]|uniref:DUF2264 domain-containing protein n=1 Tax=Coniosporium apollinis TaxID=61459 RepID=A0ABQ9NLR2_9PEZI|nr:hypothetical protein H2201_006508 [Coniosporium apollinis]